MLLSLMLTGKVASWVDRSMLCALACVLSRSEQRMRWLVVEDCLYRVPARGAGLLHLVLGRPGENHFELLLCDLADNHRWEAWGKRDAWSGRSRAWRLSSVCAGGAQDHTSEVIGDIMDTIRRHQVALKGVVSTVVVTTLVLEGARCICSPSHRLDL